MTKIPASEILRVAKAIHQADRAFNQYGEAWRLLHASARANYRATAKGAIREMLRKPVRLRK